MYKFGKEDSAWNIEEGNGCLLASIKAVGIAGVTRNGSAPSSSLKAQQQYMRAVRLTNAALRSQNDAKRDSTLLAVNILGIFESITNFHRSMSLWRSHINGAAALLELRGVEQLKTETGGRLFVQTSMNLAIACIQQRIPIPGHVRKMQAEAEKYVPDSEDRVWRFYVIQLRFADLYAKLLPKNLPPSASNAQSIIKEALAIENEVIAMTIDAPSEWQYDIVQDNGPTAFGGYSYIFSAFMYAPIWCGMFCIRIILNDIMSKALRSCAEIESLHLPADTFGRVRHAPETIQHFQLAILASVPQHLDIPHSQTTYAQQDGLWINFKSKNCNPWRKRLAPTLPFVRLSGGYMIQWPLYVAGAADVPGGHKRNCVIRTLKQTGQSMGLQQALILAEHLEAGEGL